jgi:hypothetical protein
MTEKTYIKPTIATGDEAVLRAHGFADMPRPRAAVYIDITPNLDAVELKRGPLGEPHATTDLLMTRYYEETMRRLVKPSAALRRLGGVAFWPDESGLLVARVLLRKDGGAVVPTWLGLNAREMYVGGVIGIGLTPDALLRVLDKETGQ